VAPHDEFVERVLAVVDDIPPGRVMTYGDVAAAIGSRAARGVGRVMARYGSAVPWWRVVRASGEPAAGHEDRAAGLLADEGAPVRRSGARWRVDLRAARWSPGR
jgi:alkylated DNA nucleotide flippase Atl1